MLINKNYTKLTIATVITRLGDSIDTIAFSWLVFVMTGSRTLMGGIFIMSILPNLIVLPFAGVVADLFNKKTLVVISDISRGIFVLVLAFLYFSNLLEVWHLFTFVFTNNIFESVANPSRKGLIQTILDEEQYTKGNSYISSASSLGGLIGLGIASILIGLVGISGAILVDALTFLVSAILVNLMNINYVKTETSKKDVSIYFKMLKEGFLYLKGKKLLISLLILSGIISFMYVPFNVLQPVFVDEIMHMGVEGMTYLGVAFSSGMILGGVVTGKFSNKFKSITAIGFGFMMMGVTYAGLGFMGYINVGAIVNISIILLLAFTFAFFIPVMHAPIYGTIMKKIPESLIGRMMSVFSIFGLIAMPLGGLMVALIGDSVSIQVLYIMMGISIAVISSTYWFTYKNEEF